ncbi:MAG: hypothetical protein ABJN22_06250 [Litorimonas sp.]
MSVFVVCLFFSRQANAGAWNQRAGEGQVISTSSWSNAGQIFNDDYEAVPLRGFTKTETRLYIEQGVTEWLTLVGNGGLQTLNFRDGDSRFDFDGLDDIELGGQFKVYAREGFASAIRASYIIDSQLDNRAVDVLRGGDQIELRGLIGQSRETLLGDFFYDAQIAARTESFTQLDGAQGALTLGYKPTHRWLVMSQTYLNFSNNDRVDGFDVPEQTQLTSSLSIARQYKPGRYIQLGAGQSLLGQNIVKERNLFIGVWTEY